MKIESYHYRKEEKEQVAAGGRCPKCDHDFLRQEPAAVSCLFCGSIWYEWSRLDANWVLQNRCSLKSALGGMC